MSASASETERHRITYFGGLARTLSDHAVKDMRVSVQGRIHYTRWTHKDGIERHGCKIIAEDVPFLSRGKPATAAGTDAPADR